MRLARHCSARYLSEGISPQSKRQGSQVKGKSRPHTESDNCRTSVVVPSSLFVEKRISVPLLVNVLHFLPHSSNMPLGAMDKQRNK
jgi:hypothetical protein